MSTHARGVTVKNSPEFRLTQLASRTHRGIAAPAGRVFVSKHGTNALRVLLTKRHASRTLEVFTLTIRV